MKSSESYPLLLETLQDVRGQWRRNKILEGALLAFAGAAVVVAALVAVDNWFQPGAVGRLLLAAVLWGGLIAALLALVVRRFLEDRRDDFFAALVERQHPELRNQLINALQLGRGDQHGFSPGLIQAIVHDAGKATADMDMSDSIDRRPARRAAWIALAGLLVVGGYAVAFPPEFGASLFRVLLPISDIAPYTRTHIKSVDPGKAVTRVPEGQSLTVEVRVDGVIPAAATLYHRADGGAWKDDAMPAEGTAGAFRATLAHVIESFDYYVAAGDARSPVYRVEAVKPPRVESLTLTYTFPAYLGKLAEQVADSGGAVVAVAGTTVALELKASKPLIRAELRPVGVEPLALEKQGDDRTWSCTFVVWAANAHASPGIAGQKLIAPTTYLIHMEDGDNTPNDSASRPIMALPDLAPRVVLHDHGSRPGPDSSAPLTVDATDDHGLAGVRLLYRVNDEENVRELAKRAFTERNHDQDKWEYSWSLSASGLKARDKVEYWAEATDHNNVTGPGKTESRHLAFEVLDPKEIAEKLNLSIHDYARELESLLKRQTINRTQTADHAPLVGPAKEQAGIRADAGKLALVMENDHLPVTTIVQALDDLVAGSMADAVKLLESGRDTNKESIKDDFRARSLPVQDKIIAALRAMVTRLQNNERARDALKKMEKKDPEAHKKLVSVLAEMIRHLDELLKDETQVAGKFEKLPTKNPNEVKDDEALKALKALDDLAKSTQKWAKGSVGELPKLAEGFVDDFNLRKEANKVYEEVEKAAQRAKAETIPVAAEDLGAGLATKMKEDLESWLPDSPDNAKWVLEEPPNGKKMKIPEMPLPKSLEDLIGDLLQKADEFDKDADDVTSAWADNLDQAGWGVADGPISSFSAKGKTGNDLPNKNEMNGRSGAGRRGQSTGQMVGDTSKTLPGRPTPARLDNSKFEPGNLKKDSDEIPNGATGGGKKDGAGKIGLQGDVPPDFVKDMGRLAAKQTGVREKAEKVARKLDTMGVSSSRLTQSIELMKSIEKDLADGKYEDAARKRREAMGKMRSAFSDVDHATAEEINRARDLSPQLRGELLQSSEEAYPPGYEGLLKSYYKSLSVGDK
jgi:hypothetical protein